MKKKNLLSVFAVTALLTLGCTVTSFAAGWTTNTANQWIYIDSNGEQVFDEWRKDASGTYFYYLDSNGVMAVNSLINGTYYVGADGIMVKNCWQHLPSDDEWDSGLYWYYFSDTGKALESGWKTINGQRYYFEDYKMQTGWLTYNGSTYYLDDSGTMATGWRYLYPDDENSNEEYWFYFGSNGKMSFSKEQKIDGSYYAFDSAGRMLSGWVNLSDFTSSYFDNLSNTQNVDALRYYNAGGQQVNGWIYTMTPDGYDEGWYYFRDGRAYNPNYKTTKLDSNYCVAKIDGSVYCFDKNGYMMTDLIETSDGRLFYFDESGRMATGKVNIDGEQFYMDTTGKLGSLGSAATGPKNGYLYENGTLVTADYGTRYEIKTVDGKQYLVNEKGKIKTSGTVKDSDGNSYKVTKDSNGNYNITVNR